MFEPYDDFFAYRLTLQSFQLHDVAKGLYLIETNTEGKRIISKVQVQ